jgi:hypothetical protein
MEQYQTPQAPRRAPKIKWMPTKTSFKSKLMIKSASRTRKRRESSKKMKKKRCE